uniref:B box-type domain-containing protein n=1 Tax=Gadus morhua TaxID=8049 RepID=A0A8C4ZHS7_GADMO
INAFELQRMNAPKARMVDRFGTSVRVKEQPCVGPAEVPCDVCTGTQLKALKSCLECFMSFSQTHLEPHQRVAVLKKHWLVEPMDRLEDRMCKKHDRLLELFCQTEQVCVCQFCTEKDHWSHPVVPLKEEYEVKMAQLGKMEAEVQQMIQERQRNIQEIKDTAKRNQANADREIADGVQVLTALMRSIEKCQEDLNQMVNERLKSTTKQAEDLIKKLEQEIEDLTNRSSEVKQLSHTKDHLHFLQTFRSLKNPPPTWDWTTVEYEVDLTLDPNTADRHLILSEDGKQVHNGGVRKKLPDNPKRFTKKIHVLTRQSFSSGRFYFEVQLTHTPPGLTAYWTPSPSPSLVTVQYAVSDAMRPLAASSSRGLSCDTSPPRYPSPLPHVFVMFLIYCLCVEVFFANPYNVPPLEEHSLGY